MLALGLSVPLLTQPSCSTIKAKEKKGAVIKESLLSAQRLAHDIAPGKKPDPVTPEEASAEESRNLLQAVFSPFGKAAKNLLLFATKEEIRGDKASSTPAFLKVALESRLLLEEAVRSGKSLADVRVLHNSTLAKFAVNWRQQCQIEGGPVRLVNPVDGEAFEVRVSPRSHYADTYFDAFVATANIEEKGVARHVREGVGATLVGIRYRTPDRQEEMAFHPVQGLYLPVTMIIDGVAAPAKPGDPTVVTVALFDPTRAVTTPVGGREQPLAADLSSPLAVMLAGVNPFKIGIQNFFKADQAADKAGLYLVQPYDPNRIPILFTHGLFSSPVIWRDVAAELMADPRISTRYQCLLFAYPSSLAVGDSACLMREKLAAIRQALDPDGNDPLSRDIVAVGHSMGGILTHALIADVGDRFHAELTGSADDSKLSPGQQEELRRVAFFTPDPAVNRAIFICTPHRGANMANARSANFASRLASLPLDLVRRTGQIVTLNAEGFRFSSTSIQSLQPGSAMVAALDLSPCRTGVIYHSIIGDQGKNNSPKSTDGVVDYWSSHLDGAASELIVPTGHRAYEHEKAVAELKRILLEHAKRVGR